MSSRPAVAMWDGGLRLYVLRVPWMGPDAGMVPDIQDRF